MYSSVRLSVRVIRTLLYKSASIKLEEIVFFFCFGSFEVEDYNINKTRGPFVLRE